MLSALAVANYRSGRFAELDDVLAECEVVASRAGNHVVLWGCEAVRLAWALRRTGDLRAHLTQIEQGLRRQFLGLRSRFSRAVAAEDRLYLGEVEETLSQFSILAAESSPMWHLKGLDEANLMAGRSARSSARAGSGRRAVAAGVRAAKCDGQLVRTAVAGLALIGERERCPAFYPLTLSYANTGLVCGSWAVGPGNPHLVAAIAAGAAGYTDQARDHFEAVRRQARELPDRLLQPTVLFWYGRTLLAAPDRDEQGRGRAMVEASLTDFRALGMVTPPGGPNAYCTSDSPAVLGAAPLESAVTRQRLSRGRGI